MVNDDARRIVHVVLDERLVLNAPITRITLEWFASSEDESCRAFFGVFVNDRLRGATIDNYDHARAVFDFTSESVASEHRRAMS